MKNICSRQWNGKIYYAQQLPGDGGKDWGYTHEAEKALPLGVYWTRRFVANAHACGDIASVWAVV